MDEAESAASAAEDYSLFLALKVFENHKQTELAEKLVTERLSAIGNKEPDSRLIEWLASRLKERGELASSLTLEERLFWIRPSIEKYKTLRTLAKQLNSWDDLRAQIIGGLEKEKRFDFLIVLYLEEKEIGDALATLDKLPKQRWGGSSLPIEVAQAAKKQYPREAIRIFSNEAERFIEYRGRDNYAQAALCLREVRDVCHELKDNENWEKLIADIRERYKRLPALQDELNQLKL